MEYDIGINYSIPSDIDARIPKYFYIALGGELVSIFGKLTLIRDKDGFSPLDFLGSTAGYVAALRMTCRKLDMCWLADYWDSLPWFQSDIFDGEICDRVMKEFDEMGPDNQYYRYLISE